MAVIRYVYLQRAIFHRCCRISRPAMGKKNIKHSFNVPYQLMKTTHFTHLVVLLHFPQLLKPDTNLFCQSHQPGEK